jgi:hypothetical protein
VDDSDAISLCSWTTDQGDWIDSQHAYTLNDSGMTILQDWQSLPMPMWYSPGMLPMSGMCYYVMPMDGSFVDCAVSSEQIARGDFSHHPESSATGSADMLQGSDANSVAETSEQTTIILRNCPLECTRDMLLQMLDDEGFRGGYDFVHLPIDFQTKVGLGYAIVNMVSSSVALCVQQHFQGFHKWAFQSDNHIEVDWNRPHQGLQAHIERYRNSPLMHESVPETYRPVLFENGCRVPFPAATTKIRAPRIRHQKIKNDASCESEAVIRLDCN